MRLDCLIELHLKQFPLTLPVKFPTNVVAVVTPVKNPSPSLLKVTPVPTTKPDLAVTKTNRINISYIFIC